MKNKILVIGDMHSEEKSIPEVEKILQEIYYDKKEEYLAVWFLGDLFDKKKPEPEDYNFLTKMLVDMKKNGEVIICTGNHDDSTKVMSALNYSQHLGIKLIRHHGIIKLGDKKIYLGHHFVDQSDEYFRDNRFKVVELSKQNDLCFTGHDHKYREYMPNFINLGSIRRVGFGETGYGVPKYATVVFNTLETKVFDITSAIPMIDIYSIEEALKIDPQTKLRLVFKDFEYYLKNINRLGELRKKFFVFKEKHDYVQKLNAGKKEVKKAKPFEEIFGEFLEKATKNKEVKKLIKENL